MGGSIRHVRLALVLCCLLAGAFACWRWSTAAIDAAKPQVVLAGSMWCEPFRYLRSAVQEDELRDALAERIHLRVLDADAEPWRYHVLRTQVENAASVSCGVLAIVDRDDQLMHDLQLGHFHYRADALIESLDRAVHGMASQGAGVLPSSPKREPATSPLQRLDRIGSYFDTQSETLDPNVSRAWQPTHNLALSFAETLEHEGAELFASRHLRAVALGPLNDAIDGGMYRALRTGTQVPELSKQLDTNALLAMNFVRAYQLTNNIEFRLVTEEILEYALAHLFHLEQGSFQHAEYYEHTHLPLSKTRLEKTLASDEWRVLSLLLDWSSDAETQAWVKARTLQEVSQRLRWPLGQVKALYDSARAKWSAHLRSESGFVRDARGFAYANAWLISALLRAGEEFHNAQYRDDALTVLEAWLEPLREAVAAGRAALVPARLGQHGPAQSFTLRDQVAMLGALLDAYDIDGSRKYLGIAEQLGAAIVEQFYDPNTQMLRAYIARGEFSGLTRNAHEALYADDRLPAVAADTVQQFVRLHVMSGKDVGQRMIDALVARAPSGADPLAHASWTTAWLSHYYNQ